jgi:hypothetical protein
LHDAGGRSALVAAAEYLLLAAAVGTLGALSRRRWRWGAIGAASLLIGTPIVYIMEIASVCSSAS